MPDVRDGSDAADLYHLALPADWEQARHMGSYTVSTRGVTLAEAGFIHCSWPNQVESVANRFYGDVERLVLLRIDRAALDAPVVEEDLDATGEAFPHVYGPIPTAAVTEARTWSRATGGAFRLE